MIFEQIVNDLKISCMDPVIIFVNIHTMLIYGILYLWFEFFPFGKTILSNLATCIPVNLYPCAYKLLIVFDGIYHFSPVQQAREFLPLFNLGVRLGLYAL